MNWSKRPISVTILACVYIVVGIVGFAYNFTGLLAFQYDALWASSPSSWRLSVEYLCSEATTGRAGLRSPGSHST